MGCSTTTQDTCTACFNWGEGGTIKARSLVSGGCTTVQSILVSKCKFYSGGVESNDVNNCQMCAHDFMNWDVSSSTAVCGDDPFSGCLQINYCLLTVCVKAADGTVKAVCRMCKRGYVATGEFNVSGRPVCIKGKMVINCEYVYTGTQKPTCFACDKNY